VRGGEWTFDELELRQAFQPQTKAIVVNTPNNPTARCSAGRKLELIRDLCVEYNVLAITDEIYEHILYDGARTSRLPRSTGLRDRTITINGLSKSYAVNRMARGLGGGAADDHQRHP